MSWLQVFSVKMIGVGDQKLYKTCIQTVNGRKFHYQLLDKLRAHMPFYFGKVGRK